METPIGYNLFSKVYDILDVTYFRKDASSPRNAVISIIGDESLKVLDMCTGTATNAIAIAKANKSVTVTGIDISKAMLNIAEKKIEKDNINNAKVYEMDATNMRFNKEVFDVALISLVLHEISYELAGKMILEAKRVLKPNGKLIVVEWEEPHKKLEKLAFYLIKKMEHKEFEDFLKLDMNHYFGKYGFEVKQLTHCDYSKVITLVKEEES